MRKLSDCHFLCRVFTSFVKQEGDLLPAANFTSQQSKGVTGMTKQEWMEELAQLEKDTLELEQRLKMRVADERSRKIAGFRIHAERIHNRLLLVEEGARFLCGDVVMPLKPAAGSI